MLSQRFFIHSLRSLMRCNLHIFVVARETCESLWPLLNRVK